MPPQLIVPVVDQGGYKKFTASGTWVVPAGVHYAWARVIGGGGGAYGSYSGGGGAFAYVGPFAVTPGASITITVGAGGTGRTAGAALYPLAGGSSSFGSFRSATGGSRAETSASGAGGAIASLASGVSASYGQSVLGSGSDGASGVGGAAGCALVFPLGYGTGGTNSNDGTAGVVEIFW
jgi:hypothetical protein